MQSSMAYGIDKETLLGGRGFELYIALVLVSIIDQPALWPCGDGSYVSRLLCCRNKTTYRGGSPASRSQPPPGIAHDPTPMRIKSPTPFCCTIVRYKFQLRLCGGEEGRELGSRLTVTSAVCSSL
jgi:hypothetical protein